MGHNKSGHRKRRCSWVQYSKKEKAENLSFISNANAFFKSHRNKIDY